MNNKSTRKILTIPISLEEKANFKMKKRGINSFQLYVQYLVLKDTEDIIEEYDVEVGPQFIKDVLEADKMSKEGKLLSGNSNEEIHKILENI